MGTRGTAHVLNQTLNEDLREDWTCYYYYIYIYIYIVVISNFTFISYILYIYREIQS